MSEIVSEFLRICRERVASGEPKYGPVRADARNRSKEALEECYDIANYLYPIMLKKWPKIKDTPEWQEAIRLNFRLYKALLKLQKVEQEMELTMEKERTI